MKPIKASVIRCLPHGANLVCCDNSGAKIVRMMSVKNLKTVKGKASAAGVGDYITVAVKKGKPDMRKQVVFAVVVRQKKEYRRADGTRIKFEDNAVVIVKDEFATPKGTMLKGVVAKEAVDRWPAIAKIASIIV